MTLLLLNNKEISVSLLLKTYGFCFLLKFLLKVQSCKLYNKKYMIVSTQIASTEIFAFIIVLVFKLFSRKVFFVNRKYNRNY